MSTPFREIIPKNRVAVLLLFYMVSRAPLSVTIIAFNEEANIQRAVQSAAFAEEVLVVDSGSTDRTRELAEAAGARVLQNPWSGYGQQKNFAQAQAKHDWVFNLDADEEISPELRASIERALAEVAHGRAPAAGFWVA